MTNKLREEIIKYAFVGLTSGIVNLMILYILTDFTMIYYLISAAIAYLLSGLYNFSINKIWTFKEEFRHNLARKYLSFLVLGLTSMVLNIFLLYLFTDVLGIYYIFSQIIALTLVAIFNFFGNKHWVFKN